MNVRQPAHEAAPRRYTSATLTTGVLVAGVLFAAALVLETLGADPGGGEMTDLVAVLEGLIALTPWAWATAGAYAVVATPVVGLLVTAWEYWSVGDRRTLLLATAVLAVLATSAVVAVLR
ncbi:MAG: DUF1634 domain-containing protein [Candidatus Limnocylindrales bacterium]